MFKLEEKELLKIEFAKKQIQETKIILKQEFYGIDKQIDEICDNVLDYTTFNKFQKTPLIINLWGMTGCGKTSLINRMLELLSFNKIYFNFANVSEKTSHQIEEFLQEELSSKNSKDSTNFIIYDEFQYAKTIEESGKEIDRSSMKIFWELLDSGIFTIPFSWSIKYDIKELYLSLENVLSDPEVEISRGKITKGENHWKYINGNFIGKSKKYEYDMKDDVLTELNLQEEQLHEEIILNARFKKCLFSIYNSTDSEVYITQQDVISKIQSFKTKEELFEFVSNAYNLAIIGKVNNFSRSCIFVIGNLDEAYKISENKNPDMSANQFNQYTSTLNTVDIKKALGRRFRNEQIARLGNIHLIYPSFSEDSYRKIIKHYLNVYKKDIEKEFNIQVEFLNSIYDIIYADGVFPTQGTRPLFSSISEIIKTKLSHIITHAIDNKIKFNRLIYSFEKNEICISYYTDNQYVDCRCFPQVLRVEDGRHNTNKNFQMLCAVHETGHALFNLIKFNELPEKLCSVTLESSIGGFLLKEFNKDRILNKTNLINTLGVSLAGRIAEELVFGTENISSGASSDLNQATNLAVSAIRNIGFGNQIAITDWSKGSFNSVIYDKENGDTQSLELLDIAYNLTKTCLIEQKVLLYHISKYLSTNNNISKRTFKRLARLHFKGELPTVITNNKKKDKQYIDLFNKFKNGIN